MSEEDERASEHDVTPGQETPLELVRNVGGISSQKLVQPFLNVFPKLDIGANLGSTVANILADVRGFDIVWPQTHLSPALMPLMTSVQGIIDSLISPLNSHSSAIVSGAVAAMRPSLNAMRLEDTIGHSVLSLSSLVEPPIDVLNTVLPSINAVLSAQLVSFEALKAFQSGILFDLDWVPQFLEELRRSKPHLPANWRGVALEPDDLEDEVRAILEDGIPLAWVPSARVIELLLAASDAPARRRVIANNYRGILTSCEDVINGLARRGVLLYADMIRKAIRALRDGHVEAAQSLATNVLDTLITQHSRDALGVAAGVVTNRSSYVRFRKEGWRIALAIHPVTTIMKGNFTLSDRPGGYRRNATAHAITRHQYNRINSVLAIANASALLTCFTRDTPAFD